MRHAAIEPIHAVYGGLQEDDGVVGETDGSSIAPHGEVGRDLTRRIGGVARLLTSLNCPAVLAQAAGRDRLAQTELAVQAVLRARPDMTASNALTEVDLVRRS